MVSIKPDSVMHSHIKSDGLVNLFSVYLHTNNSSRVEELDLLMYPSREGGIKRPGSGLFIIKRAVLS